MATVPETSIFTTGIYQLETTDPVEGGAGGIANQQAEELANRTLYLKNNLDIISAKGVIRGVISQTGTSNPTFALSKNTMTGGTLVSIVRTGLGEYIGTVSFDFVKYKTTYKVQNTIDGRNVYMSLIGTNTFYLKTRFSDTNLPCDGAFNESPFEIIIDN